MFGYVDGIPRCHNDDVFFIFPGEQRQEMFGKQPDVHLECFGSAKVPKKRKYTEALISTVASPNTCKNLTGHH